MAVESAFPRARVIPSDDVIGRHGFLEHLEERLYFGDSIMLAGPRRIGKTSIANEALRQLQKRGCLTLQLDLLHIVSIENFAIQVYKQIASLHTGKLQSAFHSLRDIVIWLSRSEWSLEYGDFRFNTKLPGDSTVEPLEALENAFELVEKVAKKRDKRLVFLLDEFQEVERIGGSSLLNALRTVFQHQENTTYLFLGSEPSLMKTIFADRRRAFYSFATMLHLPAIEVDEWETYTLKKLQKFNMTMDAQAIHVVFDITGGHPHGMMAALLNAFLIVKQENQPIINPSTVEMAVVQTLEQFDPIYEELWKHILPISKADQILIAIAFDEPPYRGQTPTYVKRAIDFLIKNSIIYRSSRGRYQFVEPLFKRWIIEKNG